MVIDRATQTEIPIEKGAGKLEKDSKKHRAGNNELKYQE